MCWLMLWHELGTDGVEYVPCQSLVDIIDVTIVFKVHHTWGVLLLEQGVHWSVYLVIH